MPLSTILIAIWIITTTISQYFLNWVKFGPTGLVVIGLIGLIGAALWLLGDFHPITVGPRRQQ